MARVWIEDRENHADYQAAMEKWQAAKREGSKRQPPGRWRVRWYGPDGKPKAKTFGKLPQAEAEVHAITARLDKGSYRDPKSGKTAVRIVAEEWFTSKRRIGRTTRHDYRELLDNYVIPKWGDWQVAAIQWEDVSAWITDLCTKPGKSGRVLGAQRVVKTYRVLSMVMKHAVFSKRIASSPCHDHDLPRPDDDEEHVYLTYDQLERLASAAGEYRLLVLTLGYCGIRWAEASAVKVGRLNVPQRRIRIVQNYTDVRGELALGPVKNHEKRSVPLPRSFADELGTLAHGRGQHDLLFTAPEGGPLRYSNFRSRIFDPAVRDAGLGGMGVTPHKLRHTAASLAIAAGADVKVVQTMLGHKDASMTLNVYGHLFPDRLDEVADALDAGRKVALALAGASLTPSG
ncbi:tyrosine-type recombinase/integrase [Streptomyces fradiae]|uniref:tyrosine-type recombinase/integrase n=1 Tax=Streptomyces fradiae TaxID=1906 RepID=UPI00378EA8DA